MKLGESLGKSQMSNIVMLPLVHSVMAFVGLLGNLGFTAISRFMALQAGRDIISPTSNLMQSVSQNVNIALLIVFTALFFDAALQKHARIFQNLAARIRNFSIRDAGCSCCSNRHVDPVTKDLLSCDRAFIQAIVQAWFGSCRKFDKYAQDIGNQRLPMMTFNLPYSLMLFSNLPWIMDGIGGFIWLVKSGQGATAVSYLAERTYVALVNSTLIWRAAFFVHHRLPLASGSVLARLMSALLRATLIGLLGAPLYPALQWSLIFMDAWGYFLLVPTFGGLTFLAYRN